MVAIVMRLGAHRTADPQFRPDIGGEQRHRILPHELGHMAGERQHLDRDERRGRRVDRSGSRSGRAWRAERRLALGEGEFAQIGAIAN
jgi:hypothetical protein